MKILNGLILLGSVVSTLSAQRVVIPLDGEWRLKTAFPRPRPVVVAAPSGRAWSVESGATGVCGRRRVR